MLAYTKYALFYIILSVFLSCKGDYDKIATSTSSIIKVEQDFHSEGNLATETNFNASGQKHGLHQEWFPNGKLQVEKMYNNGQLTSEKLYTIGGKIIQNIVYKDGRKYGLLYSSFCMNGVAKSADKDSLIFNAKN